MSIVNRGATWNKWDIHIHTPFSILNNQFGSDWDKYVENLFKKAIEHNIKGIGITDYFSIDGYNKILNEYLLNDNKLNSLFNKDEISFIKEIVIFPNIEFRIDKIINTEKKDSWNKRVNLHVLFSDSLSPEDIIINFLNLLSVENFSIPSESPQRSPLNTINIERIGKKLKQQQSSFASKSDYHVGLLNIQVNLEEIIEVLNRNKELFQGNYLIGTPVDEELTGVSWFSSGHLSRKNLYRNSNFILSSNEKTVEFCLGKYHRSVKEFEEEFVSQKPCLWGSDAHSFTKLFVCDNDRYTWVKSELSFEGLKQIIFEPEDRVKIQAEKPKSKTPYNVIDKIRFLCQGENLTFAPQWIHLNENLNVIIGGKSSGKSLLLYHIANATDSEQALEKANLTNTSLYNDLADNENAIDFEVAWNNGTRDLISLKQNKGQITYIPQLFINHIAEKQGEKELQSLLENILYQEDNVKEHILKIKGNISTLNSQIQHKVRDIIQLETEYYDVNEEFKMAGNKDSYEKELARLNAELSSLKQNSGVNTGDEKYSELNKSKENLKNLINQINYSTKSIENVKKIIENTIDSSNNFIKSTLEVFNNDNIHTPSQYLQFSEKIENIIIKSKKDIINLIDGQIITNTKEINDLSVKLDNINHEIKPYLEKISNQSKFKALEDEILKHRNLVSKIEKIFLEKQRIINTGAQYIKDLKNKYQNLFNNYKKITNFLSREEFKKIDDEINLSVNMSFDIDGFYQNFIQLFDTRTNLKSLFSDLIDENNDFIFNESKHIDNIFDFFNKIRVKDIKKKRNISKSDLYLSLLNDYFKINYSLSFKGDNLIKMSPGKRGVVILRLLLHKSKAEHPILIDQPEDNLDNRTIFDDLKDFIKKKKIDRQIILVTHNANLVVSTDAENIIVANQAGQSIGKDNKKYRFEYVNGSLENCFESKGESGILFQKGIREHVCDILEGGKDAFLSREKKYGFSKY